MKSPPPLAFGSGLLARGLAHHEQERAFGGLSASDKKRIQSSKVADKKNEQLGTQVLRPGTWLSRTWHAEVHQVVILDDGVEYRGEHFGSLSAVARRITGTRWSGPRFFGLNASRLGTLGVTTNGQ